MKFSLIERSLIAAAKMPAPAARQVLMLICQGGMTTTQDVEQPLSEGQKHYAKREKIINRMLSAANRTLDYVRHETLRNCEKHFRETGIKSGDIPGHQFRGNQYTTFYHGSPKSFEAFDPSKAESAKGSSGGLIWLTSHKGEAEAISEFAPTEGQRSPSVKAFRHTLKNPLVVDLKGERLTPNDRYKAIEKAKSGDHDGIIFKNIDIMAGGKTADYLAVFDPKHLRETAAIASAEETQPDETLEPSGVAARITFDRNRFAEELMAALREEAETALGVAGQQLFDEIGLDDVFKVPDKAAVKFLDSRENLLSKASDEIHQDVMSTIQDGLEHGDTKKELMTRIHGAFDGIKDSRASAIANTETAAAFNFARDKAMRKAGITHKKWLHSQSPLIKEPRPTHVEADGLIMPLDEPFDVSGVKFMYPSDDSLGAGPEDIINCHCVAIPVEAPKK